MFAVLVDLHDVGVLQARDGFGFGAEASQLLAAGMAACKDHLEGDEAIELEMACLVDNAHAAAAKYALNLVARNDR